MGIYRNIFIICKSSLWKTSPILLIGRISYTKTPPSPLRIFLSISPLIKYLLNSWPAKVYYSFWHQLLQLYSFSNQTRSLCYLWKRLTWFPIWLSGTLQVPYCPSQQNTFHGQLLTTYFHVWIHHLGTNTNNPGSIHFPFQFQWFFTGPHSPIINSRFIPPLLTSQVNTVTPDNMPSTLRTPAVNVAYLFYHPIIDGN